MRKRNRMRDYPGLDNMSEQEYIAWWDEFHANPPLSLRVQRAFEEWVEPKAERADEWIRQHPRVARLLNKILGS